MPIRAVLFDLDNTLYDYDRCNEPALRAVHRWFCDELNATTNEPLSWDRFMDVHNAVRRDLAGRLRSQAASHHRLLFFRRMLIELTGQPSTAGALNAYTVYVDTFLEHIQPHPDAVGLLTGLQGKVALALVTNQVAEFQYRKVGALAFERFFDVIMTSEDAGVDKPGAAIFEQTLEQLGVAASEAVMVGDHLVGDIGGAKQLGMATIFTSEFTQPPTGPVEADHHVQQLSEVLPVIDRLLRGV